MPVIHISILRKTLDQKKELVKNITEAVVKSIGVKPEKVTIFIDEFDKEEVGNSGKLYSETQ